ncbi:hypothetical protein GH714_019624 [Hevea brasiliensis]|uniref:Alpha/beta hydrolase fold-3 domain-containing protein n=1 Tax=Hevea brasiliensis TaxID=3981 RepID=A0A6A6K640_HEVBR|nr:hypothetical protein GH714_019624 [Hevea brasiliensis]
MGSIAKEVAAELLPFLRVFNDGSAERLLGTPIVPPSRDEDPETGVSSKEITISQDPPISARLCLPRLTAPNQKLPILVYFHGGGFCIESAFSLTEIKYMNSLVSLAKVVAISVEYSAGANISHNMAMRVGSEGLNGDVKLLGTYLTHPYFWGSKPVGSESSIDSEQHFPYRVCSFLYPSAPGGIDNPMINPVVEGAPSLAGLGGSRLLVSVAEKDELRERSTLYYNAVKESGWKGAVELIEVEGEDHSFHIFNYKTKNAKHLIKRLASFLPK